MLGRLKGRSKAPDPKNKIDVAAWIDRIEGCLDAGNDGVEVIDALAILQRWQFDQMIDEESRARARQLLRRFSTWPSLNRTL